MYDELKQKFLNTFHRSAQYLFSAPGRTEIGGNHTDHQLGRVLAGAVSLETVAAVAVNGENVIRVLSEGYPLCEIALDDLAIRPEEFGTTAALIRGVAAGTGLSRGFDAYICSTVLPGSGLSSSAAFEVLLGTIASQLSGAGLNAVEIAQLGQKVENEVTKSETRDRLAAAYPFDISFQSTVVNGVNFVALDDVYNAVTADQAGKFEAEVKKGLPIVLCMHCPFGSPRHSRCPTIPPPTGSGPSPITRSYFGRGGRGGDEGLARTRGGYLRKTWRNRGKNEVRPGALSPQILFFQLHLILSQIPSADAILPDHGPR